MKSLIVVLGCFLLAAAAPGIWGHRIRMNKEGICACPRIYMPICASDQHTYGNECLMDCESFKMQTRGLGSLRVLRGGACDEPQRDALEEIRDVAEPVYYS
ncbi:serine protease inhibitor Kazal-type 1-like [Anthonomus grandis grandis]|uniref:serine protease inhibitor Kazal-type 1-like n=1 Tax=Anthonomus grandis grandis TaxID=2921223 RepID=UPI0021653126|nr:serine protease inhibitor Kazal-type 1-like [Anthonomus grandis grandis]